MRDINFMKDKPALSYWRVFLFLFLAVVVLGCVADSVSAVDTVTDMQAAAGQTAMAYRPGVTWQPSYSVDDVSIKTNEVKLPAMQVGADIHTKGGRVRLSDVMRQLAELKGMSVNWASDVNQDLPVEVNINADDDFWKSLAGILKQLDYFYEFKNNTITVKYKDTKKFYLPMPFVEANYKTAVGGDLLGGASGKSQSDSLKGTIAIKHIDEKVDIWVSIKENLDKILNLATAQAPQKANEEQMSPEEETRIRALCEQQFPSMPAEQALCLEKAKSEKKLASVVKGSGAEGGKQKPAAQAKEAKEKTGDREGYFYTIDKPLGIITVTAPKSIIDQVEIYFDALRKEMSRQVVIEAKIIEVYLNNDSQKGIDWTNLLQGNNSPFKLKVTFGNKGTLDPKYGTMDPTYGVLVPQNGAKLINTIGLGDQAFQLVVNAMEAYGNTKVLSNPKLSLMNGQSAMMTVGTTYKYIDKVTSTISTGSGTPLVTYTVDTADILSGIGLGVMASISAEDEVVLHLTPITSQLQLPIEYKDFGNVSGGGSGAQVGLPQVFLRELTTMARVKNGQILVIGGLIDEEKKTDDNKIPLLGDIPWVGQLFKHSHDSTNKRELVILLRPEIVNL